MMLSTLSVYNQTQTGLQKVAQFTSGCIRISTDDTLSTKQEGAESVHIGVDILPQPFVTAQQISYVSSINQILPSTKGSIFLLGDKCISFAPSSTNDLYMFDGCYTCDSCQKLWEIQQALHETGNLISILKDCQLYQNSTVTAFLKQMRTENNQFRSKAPQCVYNSQLEEQYTSYKAIKLLYQYRAAVAMWNYLAQKPKSNVYIAQAQEDYSGFTVQAKQALDLCTNLQLSNAVQLQINITLEGGQTQEYLQKANLFRGCYIQAIPQSTYLTQGQDIGTYSNLEDLIYPEIQYKSVSPTEHIVKFIYKPQTPAQVILSAGLKLLPVITKDKTCPARITLQQFTQYRKNLSAFDVQKQLEQNMWRVQITWKYYNSQQKLVEQTQTRMYTTAFTRLPL